MILVWSGFVLLILLMLALDLGIFHRRDQIIATRDALIWSAVWIALSLAFSVFIYFGYEHHWLGMGATADSVERSPRFPTGAVNDGKAALIKYLTGYVVEKSLSVDNIFVMAMLFSFFAVPAIYQHRVLFWGIVGAMIMRGVMIALGAGLIAHFSWILYVFGAFLLLTAIKMLVLKDKETDPGSNFIIRLLRRLFPVTEHFHGHHFLVRAGSRQSHEPRMPGESAKLDRAVDGLTRGRWMLTPLAVALVVIEFTDLVFAVDSIPAIFSITADPFLVFTSNIFAILGLRSLYFALAGALATFKYLKVSLAIVLAVVGGKMLVPHWLKEHLGDNIDLYLLMLVLLILAVGLIASLLARRRGEPTALKPEAARTEKP